MKEACYFAAQRKRKWGSRIVYRACGPTATDSRLHLPCIQIFQFGQALARNQHMVGGEEALLLIAIVQ